jgi:hypothetical protein
MAQPIGMKAGLIPLGSPYSVENGATNRNAGVLKVFNLLKLALIFPYSAENGASNRSKGVFRFYSQLKLALSLSEVNKILKSLKQIVPYSLGHKFACLSFKNLNYFAVMLTILPYLSIKVFFTQMNTTCKKFGSMKYGKLVNM